MCANDCRSSKDNNYRFRPHKLPDLQYDAIDYRMGDYDSADMLAGKLLFATTKAIVNVLMCPQ